MAEKNGKNGKKKTSIKDIKPKKDPKGGGAINPQPLPPNKRAQ